MQCSAKIPGSSLKLDKFGNLHFISKNQSAIMKIARAGLMKVFDLVNRQNMRQILTRLDTDILYSNDTTSYIYNLNGITLEREYLYWTNSPLGT